MEHRPISSFAAEVVNLIPQLLRGLMQHKGSDPLGQGKISMPQYIAMELLMKQGRLKMKDIADGLNVSFPAATGLVNRLHKIGIVKRASDEKDRRVIYIQLTDKGKKIVDEVRGNRHEFIKKIFGGLTEEERSNYINVLRKVIKIMYPEES